MMRFMYLVSVVINVCSHMCLFCAVGEFLVTQVSLYILKNTYRKKNKIMFKCERMYLAVYEYEWYKLEPEEARTLILLMIRTSKPLHITAGKIFPMTMSMFCNVSDLIIAFRIIFVNFINFEIYRCVYIEQYTFDHCYL